MKTLVIITAHPDRDSLCEANAKALEQAALSQNFSVKRYDARDFPMLKLNPLKQKFPSEYDEPSDTLSKCEEIVIVTPIWNSGVPGILKNFFDGVTQSQKLFRFVSHPLLTFFRNIPGTKYIIPEALPMGLMKAQKVLCVWTADAPEWYYRFLFWKNGVINTVRNVFSLCGVRKFKQKALGMTRKRSEKEIKNWLNELRNYKF
jgi:putative NADPH-quinone reductase